MAQRKIILLSFLYLSFPGILKAQSKYIRLETKYGSAIIKLYDKTPKHRDNFIQLIHSGYFENVTFNRVVKDFVVQGGDSDSAYTDKSKLNRKQFWINPEFDDSLFHKKGVLAMGRDNNLDKSSFSTQFYFVTGKKLSDVELNKIEQTYFRRKYKIPEWQKKVYRDQGGTPFLDHEYTVFGEIVSGMELLDEINKVEVLKDDNPVMPIAIKFSIVEY